MPIQIDELIIRADLSDTDREKKADGQLSSSDGPSRKAANEEDTDNLEKYLNDRRERWTDQIV